MLRVTTGDLQIRQSYAYAVARVRQLENGLLDRARIARMLNARSATDALRVLSETYYSEAMGEASAENFEAVLARELERVYGDISEFVPNTAIITLFRMGYDLHNCKVAFRARFLGSDGQGLWSPLGTVPAAELQKAVAEEASYDGFPEHVRALLCAGFEHTALSHSAHRLQGDSDSEQLDLRSFDPLSLDLVLDKVYFTALMQTGRDVRSPLVSKMYRARIDLANMTGFLRCRRLKRSVRFFHSFFIPLGNLRFDQFEEIYEGPIDAFVRRMSISGYESLMAEWGPVSERKEAIAVLERLGRRHCAAIARDSIAVYFGPEPIVAYLLAKEDEVSDLHAILVGKANGLDAESIRERLSGAYA